MTSVAPPVDILRLFSALDTELAELFLQDQINSHLLMIFLVTMYCSPLADITSDFFIEPFNNNEIMSSEGHGNSVPSDNIFIFGNSSLKITTDSV